MTSTVRRKPGRPKLVNGDTSTAHAILEKAAELFMNYGYEGVSVERVAEECNLTKASIYYHFANKASLFTASMIHLMNLIENQVKDILSKDMPFLDRLYEISLAYLKIAEPRMEFSTLMREAKPLLSRQQLRRMKESEERLATALAHAIQETQESQAKAYVDPYLAAKVYQALLPLGRLKLANGAAYFSTAEQAASEVVHITARVLGFSFQTIE
ncbi:TetR/AcrR family transcriptional regulator [Alicyclobacillus tolerans]|uniref:TetR/AcrR family transcriptional regulator n=1 Tax=Alicyclobacillus TaxID=29330 RepID=UPI001932D526|nr:TetR/AcrR family transcriptional regulator [Alicyclobacillus sp. TC]QRF24019.1 TetR/AcrR family transcriptional regulator [Alicyclobacillus sp. TC]